MAIKEHVAYRDRIVQDPKILAGKPTIRGTRISVEFVLERLAYDPRFESLLAAYPHLSLEDVQACLAYASVAVRGRIRKEAASSIFA